MRAARGLSQQELADLAELSVNAISSFERGERFPRGATIDVLAASLQSDADLLLEDVLRARARPPGPYHPAGDNKALRELIELLGDRPERDVVLVLDLARRVLAELPAGEPELPG